MSLRRTFHSQEDDAVPSLQPSSIAPAESPLPLASPLAPDVDNEKSAATAGIVDLYTITKHRLYHWLMQLQQFWTQHVSVVYVVEENNLQDHLGQRPGLSATSASLTYLANERCFHVWLGLSLAFALTGVVIAQTSRIQQVVHPHQRNILRYEVLGATQAAACHILAMVTVLLGAYRFFREQEAVQYAKPRASHWTMMALWLLMLLFLSSILIMMVLVDFFNVSQSTDDSHRA